MIDINQESWDVMVAHAEKTFPNECCGAMLGSIDGDEKKVLNRNAQKILKVLRKEDPAQQRKHEWFFVPEYPRDFTITTAATAAFWPRWRK